MKGLVVINCAFLVEKQEFRRRDFGMAQKLYPK